MKTRLNSSIHIYTCTYVPLTVVVSFVLVVSDVDIISEFVVVTSEVPSKADVCSKVVVSVSVKKKEHFLNFLFHSQ